MINKNIRFALFILLVWIISPTAALAHGFGERYDLPIPLYLYVIGGGLTVTISIFFISFMLKKVDSSFEYTRFNFSTNISEKLSFVLVSFVRVISILVFVVCPKRCVLGNTDLTGFRVFEHDAKHYRHSRSYQ